MSMGRIHPLTALLLLALATVLSAAQPARAGQTLIVEHSSDARHADGSKARGPAERQARLAERLEGGGGIKVRHRFETIPYLIVEADAAGLARLKATGEIVGIAPDAKIEASTLQSGLAIGSTYVGETLGRIGSGVAVGVIDSGIDSTHPDLAGALIAGRRQLGGGADVGSNVQDDNGHGSYISGIITSDGTLAPRGIAPGAGIVMVKAISGTGDLQLSDVAAGIDWIVANRAAYPSLKFINLSFGGAIPNTCPCNGIGQTPGDPFTAVRAAINAAQAAGILCIAAAGNNGHGANPSPPACFANVISVGAGYDEAFARAPQTGTYYDLYPGRFPICHDEDAALNSVACFSSRAGCLDFIAPGYSIDSCNLMTNGGTVTNFGTSASAAHVTAALALLQGINPALSAAELVELLRATSQPVEDPEDPGVFYDRVDVRAAATQLLRTAAPNWSMFE